MFKIILPLLVVTFINITAYCQNTIAEIKYQETIHFEVPEDVRARNLDMPSSREVKKILLINGSESNYISNKVDVDNEKRDDFNRRGRRRFRRFNSDNNDVLYQNIDSGIQLDQKDLFGKEFVIKEAIPKPKWKIIASEQRDILGYTCMKAEYKDTSQLTTAWFTPQIPISFGPAGQAGLPGLILAVSIGEDRIILATEVDLAPSETNIEVPSDKKTISRAEFTSIREEKRKEMRGMWKRRRN